MGVRPYDMARRVVMTFRCSRGRPIVSSYVRVMRHLCIYVFRCAAFMNFLRADVFIILIETFSLAIWWGSFSSERSPRACRDLELHPHSPYIRLRDWILSAYLGVAWPKHWHANHRASAETNCSRGFRNKELNCSRIVHENNVGENSVTDYFTVLRS
jgi:hypothetical protein